MTIGVTTLGKRAARRPWLPEWCRLLYLDYRRYRAAGRGMLETLFLTQGLWASAVYRSCHALVEWMPRGVLRSAAKTFAAVGQKLMEIVTGICLPRDAEIGAGLYLPSFGSIILGRGSIGENCTIEHNVTLGVAGRGAERGRPTIGNRVFIGAASMIVGKVTVGDDAYIFPGSVVTRCVPPRAVVMGYPARIVSYDGSFDVITYDGMEHDPARRAALDNSDPGS
ncbi:MAG TPA: DapH/DapD/GlmU-related protein [Burkholderiales bacterium]|nr:DapH/DapD/GlmU-related protein [Burkholderiales bacterium]